MSITGLHLENFRNYSQLAMNFLPQPVVLVGENGAGKTNILEALSFLSPGRGLRGVKLSQATTLGSSNPNWTIAGRIQWEEGDKTLGTGLELTPQGQEKRVVKIDGLGAHRQVELAEWMSVVWLTPQMGRLFLDPVAHRRKFVDRLVFALDPPHAGRLQRYEHALQERSAFLKQGRRDATWLISLEEQIVTEAIAIADARAKGLYQVAAAQDSASLFPQFEAHMFGEFESWFQKGHAEEKFKQALFQNRRIDGDMGGSRVGPHRADLEVIHRALGVSAAQCSTGEQKMLLLAITLAFVRVQRHNEESTWRRVNLLLLDDVVAHLDAHHREVLFEAVCQLHLQAWLTGTDRTVFETLKDRAQIITVENGALRPE